MILGSRYDTLSTLTGISFPGNGWGPNPIREFTDAGFPDDIMACIDESKQENGLNLENVKAESSDDAIDFGDKQSEQSDNE